MCIANCRTIFNLSLFSKRQEYRRQAKDGQPGFGEEESAENNRQGPHRHLHRPAVQLERSDQTLRIRRGPRHPCPPVHKGTQRDAIKVRGQPRVSTVRCDRREKQSQSGQERQRSPRAMDKHFGEIPTGNQTTGPCDRHQIPVNLFAHASKHPVSIKPFFIPKLNP
jgi:hypothetical protein